MPVDPRDEAPAQVDTRLRQGFPKVMLRPYEQHPVDPCCEHTKEETLMGKVINCECGEVVNAESDEELVSKVEEHVAEAHPELVGKLTRDDILGMAEEK